MVFIITLYILQLNIFFYFPNVIKLTNDQCPVTFQESFYTLLPQKKGLIIIENEVLEFIHRRFPIDCNWLNGNCFFFAVILKNRFPQGTIYYDVINGHFIFKYEDNYYDWTGIIYSDGYLVEWDNFNDYDSLQKQRIINDCIK